MSGVTRYHVAVVGGGPAGLAAAIALRREGLDVAVLERTDYRAPRVGEHLPPSAQPLLATLGLSDILKTGGHAPCPGIRSRWGSAEPTTRDYIFHPHGSGVNLSRPAFDLALVARAASLGIEVVTNAKIGNVSRAAPWWEIEIVRDGRPAALRAEFVIDATGRAAAVAKRLGAKAVAYDDLVGLVGRTPGMAPSHRSVAIEAVACGWWYSAGLADGSVVATFMTDPDIVDVSRAGRRSTWRAQIEDTRLEEIPGLASLPADALYLRTARTQRLDVVAGAAWLAVGDAAMSFDPLSSEGILKGLDWGCKAAAAAVAWRRGDRQALRGYSGEMAAAFSQYLLTRYRYYAVERRWPGSVFWQRRQAPPWPITRAAG